MNLLKFVFHSYTFIAGAALVLLVIQYFPTGQPSFAQIFGPQTILEGAKLNISCAARSVPKASLSWEMNGKPLSGDPGQIAISTSTMGNTVQSTVEILSASYLQNGTYQCLASNGLGITKHQASIQVYSK